MSVTDQQRKFIERFIFGALPVETGTDDGDIESRLIKANTAWLSANADVDSQIAQLQTALRSTNDVELHEIAEFGMNGLTGNNKVRLMAALRDILEAAPDKRGKHAKAALKVSNAFRAHLQSSGTVEACENNPFGVQVAIRRILLPVLDQLDAVLGRA
jgi:hypothetical protein